MSTSNFHIKLALTQECPQGQGSPKAGAPWGRRPGWAINAAAHVEARKRSTAREIQKEYKINGS